MYLLLVTITLFLPISFYALKRDLFSPTFLLFVGYFISAICATYNIGNWGIEITGELSVIFIVGWLAFWAGEIITRDVIYKEKNRGGYSGPKTIRTLNVGSLNVWLIVLIDIIVIMLLYKEVVRIAGIDGGITDNLMYQYKTNLYETSMSSLVIQTTKITKGAAYVFLFVFVNNIMVNQKVTFRSVKNNFIYIVPGILYCAQCLLRGGRYTVIAYIIAMVFMVYFFAQFKQNWKYELSLKTIIKIMALTMLVFWLFWLIKGVVGRSTDALFVDYITRYLGGPYELFSLYLQDPPYEAKETFAGLLTSFNKMGITNAEVRTYHEFRFSPTGIMLGNVYSGFRTYYNDYGLLGVVLLCFLMSLIFNVVYHKLRGSSVYDKPFLMILYSSLLYCVMFHFFVDYFYSRLSIGYFVEVIIMYLIYIFAIRVKFVHK